MAFNLDNLEQKREVNIIDVEYQEGGEPVEEE